MKVRFGLALVIAICGAVAAYYRSQSTEHVDKFADEVMAAIEQKAEACDTNEKTHKFLAEQMPIAHDMAWGAAYTAPNRRQPAKFDKITYCQSYFKHLINSARQAGLRDLDQPLRNAQMEAENATAGMMPS